MNGYEGKHPDDLVQAANVDAPKSLRDEFAIAAMNALVSSGRENFSLIDDDQMAGLAYKIANAMMKIRKE